MAENTNTLAGLVQMNDLNLADIMVSDLLQDAPVVAALAAVPASQGGTVHKYLKETTASGAAFRDVNTGLANAAPAEELVTVTLKYLDGSFHRDVAVADGFKDGRAAYMERETMKSLRALFAGLEKQLLQGTSADANGFDGTPQHAFTDYVEDDMVVDAGGSGGRSVWLVRTSIDDLAVVAGNDGQIRFDYDPEQLVRIITNTGTGAGYSALLATLGGWFGLQVGSRYSLGRIVNLDGTSDDLLTDDLISDAISKFPASRQPNAIVMDRTSLKELQQSRTATTPTGAPAPFPAESFGVPIIVTDHLDSSEAAFTTSTTTTT
jgi:hypothetical protein